MGLTRLLDPDTTLRNKIVEFVGKGDFGLASGQKPDGTYERVWFEEQISSDEVTFESGVFLLTKAKAKALRGGMRLGPEAVVSAGPKPIIEKNGKKRKSQPPAFKQEHSVWLELYHQRFGTGWAQKLYLSLNQVQISRLALIFQLP